MIHLKSKKQNNTVWVTSLLEGHTRKFFFIILFSLSSIEEGSIRNSPLKSDSSSILQHLQPLVS